MAEEFIKQLPKVELHAHLGGSIRNETLLELVSESDSSAEELIAATNFLKEKTRSLSDCFKLFAVIHKFVHSAVHLSRIVREMLEDAAQDNVWYLEIRSTPRLLSDCSISMHELTTTVLRVPAGCRADGNVLSTTEAMDFITSSPIDAAMSRYVEVVVAEICAANNMISKGGSSSGVVARLLLSVDRSKANSVEQAEKIGAVALAWRSIQCPTTVFNENGEGDTHDENGAVLYCPILVGLDISGDPTRGELLPLLDVVTKIVGSQGVRRLPVSVHAGEVMNVREAQDVLNWRPDRLGHMCVISHTSVTTMLQTIPHIPLELCPTSNMLTLHLPTLKDHPLIGHWLAQDYPLCICTDDSGIFEVSLSYELSLVQRSYKLSNEQIGRISVGAFKMAFLGWGEDEDGKSLIASLHRMSLIKVQTLLQEHK